MANYCIGTYIPLLRQFTAFFPVSGTGSTRILPEMAKFNSAHGELSIEGYNITVSQPSPELVIDPI